MKSKTNIIKIKKPQLKNQNLGNLVLSSEGLIIGCRQRKNKITNNKKNNLSDKQITYKEYLLQFLKETSCHGVKFIGNRNISYFERLFFIVVSIIALCIAGSFIFEVYQTWSRTPVVIRRSNSPTKVTEFPFPAITICNKNQALKSKVKDIKNDTIEYGILQMMCDRYNEIDFDKIKNETPFGNDNYQLFNDTITKLSQPCENLIIQCTYGGENVQCIEIFKPTVTDEGLCCVFNALHPKFLIQNFKGDVSKSHSVENGAIPVYWDSKSGYQHDLPKKFYPRPVLGAGMYKGLTVTLNIEIDEYYCSSTDGSGIKYNVHSPAETSLIKEVGFTLGAGHNVRVLITPKEIIATREVRDVAVLIRQCVYNYESNLSYFNIYTIKNRQLECYSFKFSKACGCIPYYMPQISPNITYCNLREMGCIYNFLSDPEYDIDEIECYNFLPGCFDLNYMPMVYTAEVYHGTEGTTIMNEDIYSMPNYVNKNIVLMNFLFNEEYYYGLVRRKFVDTTTYLSYTGGLVSLFMGISSITFIEILYFFLLKPCFEKYQYYKRRKL